MVVGDDGRWGVSVGVGLKCEGGAGGSLMEVKWSGRESLGVWEVMIWILCQVLRAFMVLICAYEVRTPSTSFSRKLWDSQPEPEPYGRAWERRRPSASLISRD